MSGFFWVTLIIAIFALYYGWCRWLDYKERSAGVRSPGTKDDR
jgi:hypothetical protein